MARVYQSEEHGEGAVEAVPVINPNTGRGYFPKALWYQWHVYSESDVCLYEATRHSFGSQMIQNNDVTVVKELMGHADIRTTEKYLHFRMAHLADVPGRRREVVKLVPKRSETEVKGEER